MKSYNFIGILSVYSLLLISTHTTSSHAEIIYLKNGDKVSGHIKALPQGQGVQLLTDFGAEVYIPWSHIERVDNKNKQAIVTPPVYNVDAARMHITSLLKTPPSTKIQKPVIQETTKPSEQQKKSLLPFKFTGRVNFGGSIQTGNSEKNSVDSDFSVKTKKGDHRLQAKGDYHRAKDEGEVTVDKAKAELIYDYFYISDWFLNSNVGLAQDDIANVDLRTTGGLGIGHQVYERDNLNLQYIMGATYLNEEFSNQSSEDNISATWSFDYDQKVIDDKYQIFHEHKLLAPSDDFDAFLFESKSGFRVPLVKGMVGTAEIDFDWDNNPPIDTTEDDTIYSMKLGYEW